MAQRVAIEQVALLAAAARIAHHAGGAAGERERAVPGQLEAPQRHLAEQVAGVERVGGRVEADVHPDRALAQALRERGAVGGVVDEAAGLEVGEEVHSDRPCWQLGRALPPFVTVPSVEAADELSRFRRMFADFATTTTARAPLYARLSAGIADDAELAGLLGLAPPTQRQPVLLFACVHALLLGDPDDELAGWYPNLTPSPADGDPLPAFRRFCRRHRDALASLLATRSTQTNEIGRCALFLPVFGLLAAEVGPLAHVDVGASAGLNLLLPRYGYRYEPGGTVGDLDGRDAIVLTCGTRGEVPVPAAIPPVATSVGLDRAPVPVTDEDATRWLEACVWPDQRDRFERLRTALSRARRSALAGDHDVRRGDAIADTPALVAEVAGRAHPVVTNSWVLNYFTTEDRVAYLEMLDTLGRGPRPVVGVRREPGPDPRSPRPRARPTGRDHRVVGGPVAGRDPVGRPRRDLPPARVLAALARKSARRRAVIGVRSGEVDTRRREP